MNKLLSYILALSIMLLAPSVVDGKQNTQEKSSFPEICGNWDGTVESDGINLTSTLRLFPDGEDFQGSLTAAGPGGTSKHYVSGKYNKSKKQYILHDVRVDRMTGRPDWEPAVMTEYILRLSSDKKSLTGTCHQSGKHDKITIDLQKTSDISQDQILEAASPPQAEQRTEEPILPTAVATKSSDPINLDDLAVEVRRASATYAGGSDYYDRITRDRVGRWPKTLLPLKVYITPGEDVRNYRDTFRQAIVTAFNDWSKSSNYRITWRLTSNKDEANIICNWVSKRADLPINKHKEQGVTDYASVLRSKTDEQWLQKVTITICTTHIQSGRALKNEDVYNVARHEVGHSLGITGHSTSKTDVMYPIMAQKLMPISMRDAGTINHLYAYYSTNSWE